MKIYICGDSTAASYGPERAPMMGWGQALGEFLPEDCVENRAMAGRSTKSFLSEGRLQGIETEIQPGDLMLIQFTHNDSSDLTWRHTEPWTSFLNNLEIFIDTARLNGALPVLLTPICIRSWQAGRLLPSHETYPDAIRFLAGKRNTPLIDLYEESRRLVQERGEEDSRRMYMHVEPGVFPYYPQGRADDAHTSRTGAEAYAKVVAEALLRMGCCETKSNH